MLVQIPYSLDELVATGQFLARRKRAGASVLRIFFVGDTDEGSARHSPSEFERSPAEVARAIVSSGVNLPWNLALCIVVGLWLMFTRLTLGAQGGMADAGHPIGALVITVCASACAEVARPARFLNVILGAALFITPFVNEADAVQAVASFVCGISLIALTLRRGRIDGRYAGWNRYLV